MNMILDKLENYNFYCSQNDNLRKAFNFLESTNFTQLNAGTYELQDNIIYYIVNEYKTKNNDAFILEAHKKYIDLQFIIKGSEIIEYENYNNQPINRPYDSENDYSLFHQTNPMELKLSPGMFAIFYPNDLHLPGIIYQKEQYVKKIVMKILIET